VEKKGKGKKKIFLGVWAATVVVELRAFGPRSICIGAQKGEARAGFGLRWTPQFQTHGD